MIPASERISGRVAVVTGGASGIGRGIAEALIAAGATVVIADIETAPLESTAEQIDALAIRTDVTDAADMRELAGRVVETHGRIDLAFNNAGVGHLAPFDQLTYDDFRWVIDVNLWGVINGMTTFLPIIRETSDAGWIVNTASMAGLFSAPGMSAYALTKYGVVALTETVAQELTDAGSTVGISVLVPGLVDTAIADSERNRPDGRRTAPPQLDQVPAGRMLQPREVGDIVVNAIRRGDLYIITHPEMLPIVRKRHSEVEAAFGVSI